MTITWTTTWPSHTYFMMVTMTSGTPKWICSFPPTKSLWQRDTNKIRTKTWRIGMSPNDMGYGMGYRTEERLTWQLKKSGWQSWSLAGAASQSQSSYRQKEMRTLLSLKLHPSKSESLHTHTCSYPRIYQAAINSAKRDRKFYYNVHKSSKTLFQGSDTVVSH